MRNIFHKTSVISPLADIEESVKGSTLSIGENSTIDSFVKIKFAGGMGDIEMGNFCYINSGCILYSGNGIKLGNDVSIGANCVFAPVNHAYYEKNKRIRDQGFLPSKGGIIIEDDCWIGAGCVILDGSHIKKGAVIGAMSLVRGKIEAYTVHAGNPLRFIKKRGEELKIQEKLQ